MFIKMLYLPIKIAGKVGFLLNKYFFTKIRSMHLQKTLKRCGPNLRVNSKSYFYGKKMIELGENCNFNGILIYGDGGLFIGNNFHSGKDCKIITVNHNFEGEKIPYDETEIKKPVKIGNNVWIGDNVIILPGTTIEEGVIIGAGAVVRGGG